MIPYILHVSLLIAIVVLLYKFTLEKETHYRWNRWILIGSMMAAFIMPLFTVPAAWSLNPFEDNVTKMEAVDKPVEYYSSQSPEYQDFVLAEESDNEEVQAPIQEIPSEPEEAGELMIFWQNLTQITLFQWLLGIYLLGIVYFSLRLIIQMGSLARQIKILPKKREGKYILLEPRDEKASYSFFHYIFINPIPLDLSTYRQILSHEKIHADQKHSFDILLAELLLIFQWFNPFAWLYRKSVRQNLEYLTDDVMVKSGADLTDYQLSLLRVSAPEYAYTMVANYNQSLLKKRILMMNAKKSSILAGWKYMLMFAVLCLSIPLFNAKAEELVPNIFPEPQLQSGPLLIDQVEATEEKDEVVNEASEEVFSEEITQAVTDLEPIPQPIPQTLSLDDEIYGTWEAIIKEDEVCLRIIRSLSEENEWNWINHHCYDLDEFSPVDITRSRSFKMSRDAGNLVFKGDFRGNKGEGEFEFVENASYRRELSRAGVRAITNELMFRLFFVKDQDKYIDNLVALSRLDIPDATLRIIQPEGVKADMVQGYLDAGLSVTRNLEFVRSRVKADLLKDYQDAGLNFEKHKSFIHSRVKPDLLVGYRRAGLDLEDHKGFINSRVKPDLLKEYKSAGLDLEENKSFIHSRVKPEILIGYRSAGLDLEDHKSFIHSRVKPELLKEYKAYGFDLEENKSFIHSRVKPSLLKEYKSARLDLEDHKDFIHSRVSPDLLVSYRKAGFNLEDHKSFIHSRVKPDVLQGYRAAGFDLEDHKNYIHSRVKPDLLVAYKRAGLDLETHKNFIHSRVNPDILQGYRNAGFDLEENKNFIHSRIKPETLIEYKLAGLDLEEHKSFIQSRVSADLLMKYKRAGFDLEEHKNYIHSRMNPDYLKSYVDAGYDLKKYKKYLNHRIKASFLQSYEAAGLDIGKHEEFILDRVDPEKVKRYRKAVQEE